MVHGQKNIEVPITFE